MTAMKTVARSAPIAILAATVLSLLVWWFWQRHNHPSAPAFSSVSSDLSSGWTPFGGAWRSSGQSIYGDSEDRGPKIMDGSPQWANYFVEADVRLLGSYGDAGLMIRSSGEEEGVDSYHGYFAGIRNMDNSFIFGRADFGWNQIVTLPMPSMVQGWYHIKLLAYGCAIAAAVTNQSGLDERSYVSDPHCLPSGRFGLKSYETSAEWKNIRVGPSSQALLSSLTKGLEPKVVSYNPDTVDSGLSTRAFDQYMDPLRREAEKHKFNLEAKSIGTLALDPAPDSQRATVRGIVTLVDPVVYVQDSTGAILVQPVTAAGSLRIGDEVEAQGTLANDNFAPILTRASFQILWPNSQVIPIALTPFELASGRNRGRFVETEGVLLSQFSGPNRSLYLKMENDTQEFYAIVGNEQAGSLAVHLEPGSRIRLRGIVSSDSAFTGNQVPFALLIPSMAGIHVMGLPSWWTPIHIDFVCLALLLIAGLLHLLLSNIQRWRHKAVLRERERLAFEIHDTLAQSFAGIAFQLQAIRADTPEGGPIRSQLDVALDMVRRSHSEAKRSITAIKPSFDGSVDPVESLRQFAERLSNGRSLQICSSCQGQACRIPQTVADALVLVGQEAISNSIRHSGASKIDISLNIQKQDAQLTVKDNGSGFLVDANTYGFGLRSMSRRAANVSAQLKIASKPGSGTSIQVNARFGRLSTLRQRSWKRSKQLSTSGT
jgi:signal transduction histidine kinase